MSHPIIKSACVVAGFAVAALAATSAYAAKPLSVKQKHEMAEAMARNSQMKAPPKTMAAAAATLIAAPAGLEGVAVPEELDNYMTVQYDAKGNPHIVESDHAAQPVLKTVEASNEK